MTIVRRSAVDPRRGRHQHTDFRHFVRWASISLPHGRVHRYVRMLTSPTLLDELDEKLRLKFKWPAERALRLREELEETCDVISTTESLTIIQADPGDDRVLECAVAGRANFIVSGDRHLLDLGEFRGIPYLPSVSSWSESTLRLDP